MKKQTQLMTICILLLSGDKITSMEAFRDYGIINLRAVIATLRHKKGMPIKMTRVQGEGHTWWGEYRILPDKLDEARQAVSDK